MRLLFVLACAFMSSPSFAEDFETVSIGHWTVWDAGRPGGCVAFNRPRSDLELGDAIDLSPVYALGFFPVSPTETGVLVYFWPGVDTRASGDELSFDFGPAGTISIQDDQGAPSKYGFAGKLSAEALDAFLSPESQGAVLISTPTGDSRMFFDIADVPEVLQSLDACVETML